MTVILNYGGGKDVLNKRRRYKYAVYEHKLVLEGKKSYTRSFIVLKNQYEVIVYFTSFHNYIDSYEKGVCVPLKSDAKTKMHYVCKMLNYVLIDNYEKYKVKHVFDIEKWMLDEFFRDHALEMQANGTYRSSQSVEKCIYTVTNFFRRLSWDFDGYTKITHKDLYVQKTSFSHKGKLQKTLKPNFTVRTMPSERKIFRDIPTKVFRVIINQAFCYAPEIAFAICLSAFAGLRPGEVCNVRQEESPLGNGIKFISVDGKVKSVEIDLRTEYVLRNDGVICGKIKKERIQRVYPAFIPAFCKVYEFHKKHINPNVEKQFSPMFVGRSGKEMTYYDYWHRFRILINEHVRAKLLKHKDPECQLYGQLLYENNLSPHSLRHFFTVQLVLMGEDIAGIQYWRGDSSPESALTYLQNKGDLVKELSETNNLLADFLLLEGRNIYGN